MPSSNLMNISWLIDARIKIFIISCLFFLHNDSLNIHKYFYVFSSTFEVLGHVDWFFFASTHFLTGTSLLINYPFASDELCLRLHKMKKVSFHFNIYHSLQNKKTIFFQFQIFLISFGMFFFNYFLYFYFRWFFK